MWKHLDALFRPLRRARLHALPNVWNLRYYSRSSRGNGLKSRYTLISAGWIGGSKHRLFFHKSQQCFSIRIVLLLTGSQLASPRAREEERWRCSGGFSCSGSVYRQVMYYVDDQICGKALRVQSLAGANREKKQLRKPVPKFNSSMSIRRRFLVVCSLLLLVAFAFRLAVARYPAKR